MNNNTLTYPPVWITRYYLAYSSVRFDFIKMFLIPFCTRFSDVEVFGVPRHVQHAIRHGTTFS